MLINFCHSTGAGTISIIDKKLSVTDATLSIQGNAKLNLVLKEKLIGIDINQKDQ